MKRKFQKFICFLLALIICTGNIGTGNVLAATTSTASKICSRHGGAYDSYIKGSVKFFGNKTDKITLYGIQYNGKKYKGKCTKKKNKKNQYSMVASCKKNLSSKESFACSSSGKLSFNETAKIWTLDLNAMLHGETGEAAGQEIKYLVRITPQNGQSKFRLYKFQAPGNKECTEKVTYKKKNAKYHQKIVTCSVSGKELSRINVKHGKNCRICR